MSTHREQIEAAVRGLTRAELIAVICDIGLLRLEPIQHAARRARSQTLWERGEAQWQTYEALGQQMAAAFPGGPPHDAEGLARWYDLHQRRAQAADRSFALKDRAGLALQDRPRAAA
jgi:hypothetical protein